MDFDNLRANRAEARADAAEQERDIWKNDCLKWQNRAETSVRGSKNLLASFEIQETRADAAEKERDELKTLWDRIHCGQSGCGCRFENRDEDKQLESCAFHAGQRNDAHAAAIDEAVGAIRAQIGDLVVVDRVVQALRKLLKK